MKRDIGCSDDLQCRWMIGFLSHIPPFLLPIPPFLLPCVLFLRPAWAARAPCGPARPRAWRPTSSPSASECMARGEMTQPVTGSSASLLLFVGNSATRRHLTPLLSQPPIPSASSPVPFSQGVRRRRDGLGRHGGHPQGVGEVLRQPLPAHHHVWGQPAVHGGLHRGPVGECGGGSMSAGKARVGGVGEEVVWGR